MSVPEGTYLCRIDEVREGTTRDGAPRWAFRLAVADGEHAGRTAAWDGFSWSERGVRRAKHVLSKLGFDTDGVLELEPDELLHRRVWAEIGLEESEDPVTGAKRVRPRVPFLGYERVEESELHGTEDLEESEEDVPWGSANGA